jgi:hypothetical protein
MISADLLAGANLGSWKSGDIVVLDDEILQFLSSDHVLIAKIIRNLDSFPLAASSDIFNSGICFSRYFRRTGQQKASKK